MTRTTDWRGSASAAAMRRTVVATALAMLLAAVLAGTASAQGYGIKAFDGQVTANAAGDAFTQAGGHPYAGWTAIEFNNFVHPDFGLQIPYADAKDILVDLPPGLVGNPRSVPRCTFDDFFATPGYGGCSPQTQIGIASIGFTLAGGVFDIPLYNMEPPPGHLAKFGFKIFDVPIFLTARLRADGDYGLSIDAPDASQGLQFYSTKILVWGNPADPVYDSQRCQVPAGGPDVPTCMGEPGDILQGPNEAEYTPVPVLTNPTACTPSGQGLMTSLRTDSWQNPGAYHSASFESHLPPAYPAPREDWGPPQGPTGCDRVPFDPSVTVSSDSRTAAAPSGLQVALTFPQDGLTDGDGIATAHLRDARVELPDGMAINPSSAQGLAACEDEQVGFGTDRPVECPDASQIGTAWATTPLLEDRIEGRLFLGTQRSMDPASGEMFRVFLVLRNDERGLLVKLPGQARVDEQTGKVVATFPNNPQLPVEQIHVQVKGGDRAPLTNPDDCGTKTVHAALTPWSTGTPAPRDSWFAVDRGCGAGAAFDPSFEAGTESPVSGEFSPFHVRVQRSGGKDLGRIDVRMPKGLVAQLKHVDLCTDGQIVAAAGRDGRASQSNPACPAGSRIGSVTVGAGSGSPYYPSLPNSTASGRVFLTEGYKGAPYGLAIEVPAVAGPFDLGTVTVRAAVHVDPDTAQLSVVSDRLPAIVKGVPLDVRDVRVDIDRARFAVNPTSCREMAVGGDIAAQDGTAVSRGTRFEVGDCAGLGLSPRVGMQLVGRGRTKLGANPALRVRLRQASGQSNLEAVKTTLPRSIALDARNSADPKLLCGYEQGLKADCPKSTVIGQATAVTPLLKRPLTGPVHLVQGIKFSKTGNRIRTTPTLLVKLAGEVRVNVRARTTAIGGRLVTTFDKVPDAAVSDFRLNLAGGDKRGILVVTRGGLCNGPQNANLAIHGHNGKTVRPTVRIATPCRKASSGKASKRR